MGGERDNMKTKSTQWAMRRAMGTLFGLADNFAIVGPGMEPDRDFIAYCLPDPARGKR